MRLIEFTEPVRIPEGSFEAGERKSFPDEQAKQYIEFGWAKDPKTGEQGTRKPGANGPIKPNPVSVSVS